MKNERRFSDGYGNMFSNPADAGRSAAKMDAAKEAFEARVGSVNSSEEYDRKYPENE